MRRALDITRLIDDLSSSDPLRRETAVARLAIAGGSAIARLTALAADEAAGPGARVAAFEALEASPDSRAVVNAALAACQGGDDEVAVAALGVLALAARGSGSQAVTALDGITATALDRTATAPRRLAALGALDGLPPTVSRPVFEALRTDPASRVVARVVRRQSGLMLPLEEVLERGLPDDPEAVGAILREEADSASAGVLGRLIEAIRRKETRSLAPQRAAWMAQRGQVHRALAARGSRVALYDLRETLERPDGPLPVGFLAAAAAIGDAGCLEPLAMAWMSADQTDRWWRDHLTEAFGAIVKREGLTRRHPRLIRLLKRSPATGPLVALARKS
jgi:hypothetical protein